MSKYSVRYNNACLYNLRFKDRIDIQLTSSNDDIASKFTITNTTLQCEDYSNRFVCENATSEDTYNFVVSVSKLLGNSLL